ncbi:MAG: Octaprenyl-diphosphate synthase [Syntrophorhabdus sp. PtaU1.Bin058]|nr:MAG: Octaprenyl-diphosphate synthase [Syntrophorhabdus sp. PtaU1.Bin058]
MAAIPDIVEKDLKKLETSIDKLITTKIHVIKEIVNYIIKSGGKRVRPILVILSARLCGYKGEKHIPYAAIIEFIHTATLLHDDVVDNAKTRRGFSTVNTVWGNEPSVLVGDFLYSKSFELMAREGNDMILQVISAATTALSEGEILEIVKTADINTTEKEYFQIIGNKTAVLFAAACEIGAILGKSTQQRRKDMSNFGYNLGMAFQLMDDILDYTSFDNVLGKRVGTDLQEGKVTLPLIHALRSATDEEKSYITKVIDKPRITARDFSRARKIIEKYNGIDYTLSTAENYTKNAKGHLKSFPESRYKEALLTLTNHMLSREK